MRSALATVSQRPSLGRGPVLVEAVAGAKGPARPTTVATALAASKARTIQPAGFWDKGAAVWMPASCFFTKLPLQGSTANATEGAKVLILHAIR